MITFVYCCVCLLIVCCQTTRIEDEESDYTNDSPDLLPKLEYSRYKIGADILMKCNGHHGQIYDQNITWEFKRCRTYSTDIQINKRNLCRRGTEWKKLDFGKRKRLEIRNATEDNVGLYRCLYNDSIWKMFFVDIFVPMKYQGRPPMVISLLPSPNSTVLPNTGFVIKCQVTSPVRPEIRWFKQCNGRRCEVLENGHCYCPLPLMDSVYSRSNNTYISKLSIQNARNIDSGRYCCLAISLYGKDYKNVTVRVQDLHHTDRYYDAHDEEESGKSFSLLFAIPFCFVLGPVTIWLCFSRRNRKKNSQQAKEQKQLIKPVVEVDIVVDVDNVV